VTVQLSPKVRRIMGASTGIRLALAILVATGASSYAQAPAHDDPAPDYRRADSLALQQFPGGLGGEWKRVTIVSSGRVTIVSDSVGGRTRRFQLKDGEFGSLTSVAQVGRFDLLPGVVSEDPVLGRACGSDGQIVVITVFVKFAPSRDATHQVTDDTSCLWAPAWLRQVENTLMRTAG
jgi:hypothetical protein